MKENYLQLSKNFRLDSDQYCWILQEATRNKKGETTNWHKKNTYHATFEQAISKFLDSTIKNNHTDLKAILEGIEQATQLIRDIDTKLIKQVIKLYKKRYVEN